MWGNGGRGAGRTAVFGVLTALVVVGLVLGVLALTDRGPFGADPGRHDSESQSAATQLLLEHVEKRVATDSSAVEPVRPGHQRTSMNYTGRSRITIPMMLTPAASVPGAQIEVRIIFTCQGASTATVSVAGRSVGTGLCLRPDADLRTESTTYTMGINITVTAADIEAGPVAEIIAGDGDPLAAVLSVLQPYE